MALEDEVTERVTPVEPPLGDKVIVEADREQVQPEGQDLVRLKVEEPQPAES